MPKDRLNFGEVSPYSSKSMRTGVEFVRRFLMPLRKILVPVDFSERCRGAAFYAEAIHNVFGSHITLLHVLPPAHYEFSAMEVAGSLLEEQYRFRAEQAEQDLQAFMVDDLPAAHTERILREGDPAGTIISVAGETGAGLIVMPTHGYGPFRRFILGSVTAKILHDADCPVWTGVHLEASSSQTVRFRQVTAALDLGPQSERTLMWASRFAKDSGAKLALIHAMPAFDAHAAEYFDPQWRRQVEAAVREEVGQLQKRLNIVAPLHIENGEISRTVCDVAADLETDLLVIGRGSAAGVFGRLRANAYSIIRESRSPVVSV
jgi:nucleotide-binding universal stress UspA family protein